MLAAENVACILSQHIFGHTKVIIPDFFNSLYIYTLCFSQVIFEFDSK